MRRSDFLSRAGVVALCLATILAGAPVSAQDADPIADLLTHQNEEIAEEEAESLPDRPQPYVPSSPPQPPQVPPPYVPPAYTPPAYTAPPSRPPLTEPVFVDELGRTPEAPPTSTDLSYEQRLRQSFAAAQGLQGAFDGAWTLRSPTGAVLYTLQIVDQGRGELGGSWLDPARKGSLDGSGFLEDVRQSGGQVTLQFTPRAGQRAYVTLSAAGAGWTGQLEQGGDRIPVTLRRE